MLSWTIGDATITSIVESETPTSPRFMYKDLTKIDVLERVKKAPWLQPHFISDDGYLLQKIHCLVIELGDKKIAVDTCIGNDKERSNDLWSNLQGPFLEDMAKAGYPASDITHVVCTHLHVDHVGWNTRLVDGEWVPTFPNARYLFVDSEYEHWKTAESLFDGEDVFGDSVAPIADAGLADLVPPDYVISDEISFQPTPGHTPGHISLAVESGGKKAIITGDMTHNPLQIADPELSSMFDTDGEAARDTRKAVFPGWADGETLIIGTHFGSPTAGTMVPDGDGYKLVV
ncbi:MAG: glyoxylase-like metal-dependent hydrolase (beta-lactamase superfamily II) [Acidimicrobiales bacterium]|jgi:glyoxylase-like metal-dependent hydrolase (beta-lactamase superfamily II)